MPLLRPSAADFTAYVKAAAQYVPAGSQAKSGKGTVVPASLGATVRTSVVGATASPASTALVLPHFKTMLPR